MHFKNSDIFLVTGSSIIVTLYLNVNYALLVVNI